MTTKTALLLSFCFAAVAGCGGTDPLVGSWKSADNKYSLTFTDVGAYEQWDTQFPPASLAAVDPAANPNGAKAYGTYVISGNQLSITAHDGLFPKAQTSADSILSSTFAIASDSLTAPGLVAGVSTYGRVASAP